MFSPFSRYPILARNLGKNQYHVSKTPDTPSIPSFPLCIDCRFYLPMEHSPFYPNSACKYYTKPSKTCISSRADSRLCGPEGQKFLPRILFHPQSKNPIESFP